MPVSTKVGVSVHLKTIDTFGVQHDSLRICVIEILNQVDYCFSVWCPWILGEEGALVRCIGDVCSGALLQEVELSYNCLVVEQLIERRG